MYKLYCLMHNKKKEIERMKSNLYCDFQGKKKKKNSLMHNNKKEIERMKSKNDQENEK